ncbi:ApaLI family restriction endonuclease [Sulfurospirillum sp.]|uniref:ApaLI family restriction endonuclease n=1 Tax=Sulfurospirillum sp. TaxID=2053622 RepID=UPI002FDD1CCF
MYRVYEEYTLDELTIMLKAKEEKYEELIQYLESQSTDDFNELLLEQKEHLESEISDIELLTDYYPIGLDILEDEIEKIESEIREKKKEENIMAIEQKIKELAKKYADNLKTQIDIRTEEMKGDDKSHYLIYQVLGITDEEGDLIDLYQNKGRFLYKYAGSFLEEATKLCFLYSFSDSATTKIVNTLGQKPKTFEIDCLEGNNAIEIKWKDATTDGDHITKEHTRIKVIHAAGYNPIRVMFYYPNREQAMRIQSTLETLYKGIGGEYYHGNRAWEYVKNRTGIDLKKILEKIAEENTGV